MTGMIRIFDGFLQDWKLKKHDKKLVLEILYKKNFRIFLANFQQIFTSMYYAIINDLLDLMVIQLDKNIKISNTYTYVAFSVILGLFFVSIGILIIPIQKILVYFSSTLQLFPIALIDKNMVLKHNILKLKEDKNIYDI